MMARPKIPASHAQLGGVDCHETSPYKAVNTPPIARNHPRPLTIALNPMNHLWSLQRPSPLRRTLR